MTKPLVGVSMLLMLTASVAAQTGADEIGMWREGGAARCMSFTEFVSFTVTTVGVWLRRAAGGAALHTRGESTVVQVVIGLL